MRHAEIAGGGIGGLGLGMMLARRGWSVRVHERSPEIREFGAGISLRNNCLGVLEHYDIFKDLQPLGTTIREEFAVDPNGRVLQRRDLTGHHRTHVLPRQSLVDVLAEAARTSGVDIVTSSRIASIDPAGALIDEDGRRYDADLAVGADGVRSATRQSLQLGEQTFERSTRVATFIVPQRLYTVDHTVFEHWSGKRRVGVLPCGENRTFIFLVTAKDDPAGRMPPDRDLWLQAYPQLGHVFDAIREVEGVQFPYRLVLCPKWSVGHAALIGDAAHAMPPSLGQGAGLTLMNSHALAAFMSNPMPVPQGLQRWENAIRYITEFDPALGGTLRSVHQILATHAAAGRPVGVRLLRFPARPHAARRQGAGADRHAGGARLMPTMAIRWGRRATHVAMARPRMPSMTAWLRSAVIAYAPPVATFVVCLLLWEGGVRLFHIPLYLLPPPSLVIAYIATHQPLFFTSALETVRLVIEGFGISIILGIPLGVLLARSQWFARTVYPLLVASQTFPKLAVGPLFVVWFGFGSAPKLLLAFLVAFFPIMIDTTTGLRAVRPETLMLAKSLGLGRVRSFLRIQLPQALPSIFAGLRIGSTLAVLGVLVAEFLGAAGGLGYLVITATGSLDTVLLFAALAIIALIGLLLYALVALVEHLAIGSWYPPHTDSSHH